MRNVYIFDFDGTLVDSMDYWAGVHIRSLEAEGIAVPEDFVGTITPIGNRRASEYTVSLGLKEELSHYLERVSAELYSDYTERVPLKEGVKEALLRFRSEGRRLAVLTASPHLYVDECLKRLGVAELFEEIWSVDDFGITKDKTAIYEKAAERLAVKTEDCVFFDDNITAVGTAKAAGMYAAAVYDKSSAALEGRMRELSDVYLYSINEFKGAEK